MANHRVESIPDLIRWNLDLVVTCRKCSKRAVFDAQDVLAWALANKRPTRYPPAMKFSCACGHPFVQFGFCDRHLRPVGTRRRMMLTPVYVIEGDA